MLKWCRYMKRVWESSNLWCHPVAEIQDGYVVIVRPLVQTQISLEGVFQLKKCTKKQKMFSSVISLTAFSKRVLLSAIPSNINKAPIQVYLN